MAGRSYEHVGAGSKPAPPPRCALKRIHQLLTVRRFAGEGRRGFTLVEITLVVVIVGLLAALAVPNMQRVRRDVKVTEAMADIRILAGTMRDYRLVNGSFPPDLDAIGMTDHLDPWGNAFGYLLIEGQFGVYPPGQTPKQDQFLRPINTDFDVYSFGPDGESSDLLTDAISQDDVIRANDGNYVGTVEDY